MNSRHEHMCRIVARRKHGDLVLVAKLGEAAIGRPTVGVDAGTRSDRIAHESGEACRRTICNPPHANTTETPRLEYLHGDDDNGFLMRLAAFYPGLVSANVRLVYFY